MIDWDELVNRWDGDCKTNVPEADLQTLVDRIEAEVQQPAVTDGSAEFKLERYGLKWTGPRDFVPKPMPDGYWTPWHIAQMSLDRAIAKAQQPAVTDSDARNLAMMVRRLARRVRHHGDEELHGQAIDLIRRTVPSILSPLREQGVSDEHI